MSLTKTVATFAFVATLAVAFSSSNELQAQSGSRSVGGGSSSRSLPSVVTDFGGTQQSFAAPAQQSYAAPAQQSFGTQQSYVAPQVEYSGAPVETQYSPAPMVSSGPAYSPAVSSGCGCNAAPAPMAYSAPAPQPVASPCGGGGCGSCGNSGGGCGSCGGACGNRDFGTLRRSQPTGRSGGLFQRGRPCNGCN